jgi:hypothetical protein
VGTELPRRPNIFESNAAELRRLHDEMHRQWGIQRGSPAHVDAARVFRERYDALGFPAGLSKQIEALKGLEPPAVEMAIRFLEADPWFHRSGYIKEEFALRLKHASLLPEQRDRVRAVIERSLSNGTGRVASHLARLAPAVRSDSFIRSINLYSFSKDGEVRRRAAQVLRVLRIVDG